MIMIDETHKLRKARNQAALRSRQKDAAVMCGFKTITALVNAILNRKVKIVKQEAACDE